MTSFLTGSRWLYGSPLSWTFQFNYFSLFLYDTQFCFLPLLLTLPIISWIFLIFLIMPCWLFYVKIPLHSKISKHFHLSFLSYRTLLHFNTEQYLDILQKHIPKNVFIWWTTYWFVTATIGSKFGPFLYLTFFFSFILTYKYTYQHFCIARKSSCPRPFISVCLPSLWIISHHILLKHEGRENL